MSEPSAAFREGGACHPDGNRRTTPASSYDPLRRSEPDVRSLQWRARIGSVTEI